jgi:type IV secretory pathway TraG/TraD family ATPase VirD4
MERLSRRPSSDLSLLRAIRRAAIVCTGLPRAQDKESGRFGQFFLADLDAVIQEIQATEGRLAHAPFTIILDEFASYAIHEFAAVFEQARSAGIAVIVSVQTPSALADIQRGFSEEFRDACVGNCGTILSFRLGPGRGAQYLSDYVGSRQLDATQRLDRLHHRVQAPAFHLVVGDLTRVDHPGPLMNYLGLTPSE